MKPIGSRLVTFDLHYEVVELAGSVQKQLVRNAGGNSNNVSGAQRNFRSTLNGSVALLMGRNGFRVLQGSADEQRRSTGLHNEAVGLGLVPLRLTICLAVGQHEGLLGAIDKPIGRD